MAPVPLMTAPYPCLSTSGVILSMVAKKFETKVSRSGSAAVLLEHIRVPLVALGSHREGLTRKQKKRSKNRARLYIEFRLMILEIPIKDYVY